MGSYGGPTGVVGTIRVERLKKENEDGTVEFRIGKIFMIEDMKHPDSQWRVAGDITVGGIIMFGLIKTPSVSFGHQAPLMLAKTPITPLGGWMAKDLYSSIKSAKLFSLLEVFENALKKGIVRGSNEAGIKILPGKRVKVGGTFYKYELKTIPHSLYGNYRAYRNVEDWTDPAGVTHSKIIFRIYESSH